MTDFLDPLHQPHAQLLLRLVLGGVLLLAALTKLADRDSARAAVSEYEILPKQLERPFAAILPWLETALGALLLLGLGTTLAAALAMPLFLSFAVAIGVNLAKGRHFDCHCFGSVQSEHIGGTALLRSVALVLVALVVAVGASRFGALEGALFGSGADLPPASEVIPIVFLAAVVFDVLILLPEAVAFRAASTQWRRTRITGSAAHQNGHQPTSSTMEVQRTT